MANLGTIRFRSARASGLQISQLGSGLFDFLGFFGAAGHEEGIEIGSYNDTSIVVTELGIPQFTTFGGSSYCTNCKFITSTTAQISGLPAGPYIKPINQINVFHPGNLTTAPNFRNRASGTLLVQYTASGTSKVHTFNAKMYGYDRFGAVTDPPPNVTVLGFEINASGLFKNAAHSGQWHNMMGRDDALEFVDHSPMFGYRDAHTHLWVAAITCRANSVGILNEWAIAMQLQFV